MTPRTADDARHRPIQGDRRRCGTTGKVYVYDGWYASHPLAVWARTGIYADKAWEWAPLGGAFESENNKPAHSATGAF